MSGSVLSIGYCYFARMCFSFLFSALTTIPKSNFLFVFLSLKMAISANNEEARNGEKSERGGGGRERERVRK